MYWDEGDFYQMIVEFIKQLFQYVSQFEWWQGLIILFVVIFTVIIGNFWKTVLTWVGERIVGERFETLQYRMFWGLSNDAVNVRMKDEIRRSFKENGFCEFSDSDFSQYVKNQSRNLLGVLKNHIINLYPSSNRSLKVSMEDILDQIDENERDFISIFFDIYMEAKKCKKYEKEKCEEIDQKFTKEIENFIINKNEHMDCVNCLTILFGKREIAENKKKQIKTLKNQMNFAERKLSEIHSKLITFFSEKINNK